MEKIKLVIVDSDIAFTEKVKLAVGAYSDIEILGSSANGAAGLEMVRKLHPNAVLYDLVLPGLDGISLLKEMELLKNPPMAICCTQFYSTVSLETCRNLGASYFLFKPIDFHALYETIKGCYLSFYQIQKAKQSCFEQQSIGTLEIHNYIVSLGVPARLIGCNYLSEGIRLAMKDISLTQNLSKGLYLEIARNMNTSPSCVERCIRNAIGSAFQNGRLGTRMMTCPSNKEFINYVLRTFEA